MPLKKKFSEPIEPLENKRVEHEELREFAAEAEQVELMTRHPGYAILKRDIDETRQKLAGRIPYLNPETPEYKEARVTYLALDKLIKTLEDYAENRKRILELLNRLDNPEEHIMLDVDNN